MSLLEIMKNERESLEYLKTNLKEQYRYIMLNDIFKLEEVVEEIQKSNRVIAKCEINRRKELAGRTMKEVADKDSDIKAIYEEIRGKIEEIKLQKETNELLIKQQLVLTNRMLSIINPKREQPIYNSYGKVKR